MPEKIVFSENDRIAVIAPHPDDECLGASAALILAPERTDIYVLTDGSHGNPDRTFKEEAAIRKSQFEAEMEIVKPHAWKWMGYEDTTLDADQPLAGEIDFVQYTKIFLPWSNSFHPDHRAACAMCCREIGHQASGAECFMYEITAPFYKPTHYIDVTNIIEEKRRLIRCHVDQNRQEGITLSLNAFRGAQMLSDQECLYAECYIKAAVDSRF